MGGLAAVIDWDRPVAPHELDPMLSLTPHRATGGTRRIGLEHAALAESFFSQDAPDHPGVVSVAHLSIVGDLRLWNRDGLRARAGGISFTAGMDDRRLLLEAYQRTGIGLLDDVDGDFAFLIWDDRNRRVLAVRDRFGAKPLYFERTPTGIRFASEVKQLAATSARPIEPCARSVAEHLAYRYEATRFTFFEGIQRVRPSTALVADPEDRRETVYWDPAPETVPSPPQGNVSEGFREHLVESVRRRLTGTDAAVAHVTGGLDSSSVSAAAHILTDRSELPTMLHTASAVFPGHSNDETPWIDEIASRQPFVHHGFVPRVETIERYETDMWESDTPFPIPIAGLWAGTIEVANGIRADVVLTGDGGDEVLDQFSLLPDLLRRGRLLRWASGVRSEASFSRRRLDGVAAASVRAAFPAGLKKLMRPFRPRSDPPASSLIRSDLWDSLQIQSPRPSPTNHGFASTTQNLMISYTQAPRLVQILEHGEGRHSRAGLSLSHPFLDRTVIEFVASIPITERPVDGRTKALTRTAFAGYLPDSVLNRRTPTYANGYLDGIIARLQPYFRERYPIVSDAARPFLDNDRYVARLQATATEPPTWGDGLLWNAWTLMAWLDQIGRYAAPPDKSSGSW